MATILKPSCGRCSKFLNCPDKRKNLQGFSCDRFAPIKIVDNILDLPEIEMIPRGDTSQSAFDPDIAPETEFIDVDGQRYKTLPENFIEDAMNRAFDTRINTIRDVRIDDSQIPFAANYYDFCANLAGSSQPMPFARQFWAKAKLLGEICPYCTKPEYFETMDNIPVDADVHDLVSKGRYLRLMGHGICSKCGHTKYDAIRENRMCDFTESVWCWGQRCGKTFSIAGLTVYVYHRHLMSPQLASQVNSLGESGNLTSTFVALTTTNSYKLLWVYVRNAMIKNKWFKEWFEFMDNQGRLLGKQLYQFNPAGTYFRSFTKNLDCFPCSPMDDALRGYTRFLAATDELAMFPFNPKRTSDEDGAGTRKRADADNVYEVLSNSLLSVRGAVRETYTKGVFTFPQGLNLSISSPSSWRDKVMRLYESSKGSPTLFGLKAPTWDINPHVPRDHPEIQAAYRADPVGAEKNFGANPPRLANNVFLREHVLPLFAIGPHTPLNEHGLPAYPREALGMNVDSQGDNPRSEWGVTYQTYDKYTVAHAQRIHNPSLIPPALLSLDAGLIDNSFALTLLSPHPSRTGHWRATAMIDIIPAEGKPINFPLMYKHVIKPLIEQGNVREVYADRWNSIYILQQILEEYSNIEYSMQYSLKPRDCDAFHAFIKAQQLHLPAMEVEPDFAELTPDYRSDLASRPASHLYRQFLTVQKFQGMFIKGSDSTDDILRALMLAVTKATDQKVAERFSTYKTLYRDPMPQSHISAVGSRYGSIRR